MNRFGQGQAYYIATQGSDELLQRLARFLCDEAGIQPLLEVPEHVEVTRRVREDGRAVYFLLNHGDDKQAVQLPAETFASLLDGKDVSGEIELAPRDVMVLLD